MSHVHAMCLELASSKKFSAHAQICQHAWMEKHHNYINYLFANKARKNKNNNRKQKHSKTTTTTKQKHPILQFWHICNGNPLCRTNNHANHNKIRWFRSWKLAHVVLSDIPLSLCWLVCKLVFALCLCHTTYVAIYDACHQPKSRTSLKIDGGRGRLAPWDVK